MNSEDDLHVNSIRYNKWPYYDLIDTVLGDRPATRPPVVIDTTLQSPGSQLEEESDKSQQNTSNISSVNSQTPSTDPDMKEEMNVSVMIQ